MAIRMPQPFKRKSGVYHLNARVPADLMKMVPGTRITLPLGDSFTSVKATDKVVLSLRTKDLAPAVERCSAAFAALCRHWQALRAGPKPLRHEQIVALAGEAYRRRAAPANDDFDPETLEAHQREREEALAAWRYGEEGEEEISEERARFFEAIQRPMGPELLAFETKADVVSSYVSVRYEDATEALFGDEADNLLGEHQLIVDATTRAKLVRQIAEAVRLAGGRLVQKYEGDYSPDQNLQRFPALAVPAVPKQPERGRGAKVTVDALFERWKTFNAKHVRLPTIRRYDTSIASLSAFLGARDVRTVAKSDIEKWADHRRDVDGIAPTTVNRNDLVAASSVFNFATTRESDKDGDGEKRPLRNDNPVKGVKLKKPAVQHTREKKFRASEIGAVLTLARNVVSDPKYPKASASRRFAPFICAYSGARIQEVCWLSKEDIRNEGGIFVMCFLKTKNGSARTVPIHQALIDEGLLDYWCAASPGLLFTGDKAQAADASRSQAEQRASEIAAWITSHVKLESGASPNHGWRHTFISRAQGPLVRMAREMACEIAGHNQVSDAHRLYEHFTIIEMKGELDRFPHYAF